MSPRRSTYLIVLYGLAYFFANFGPNATTFLLPVETYPTRIRASCHGFSAAMGKIGAFAGSTAFVLVKDSSRLGGTRTVLFACSVISLLGLIVTCFFVQDLPEGSTLADLDEKLERQLATLSCH